MAKDTVTRRVKILYITYFNHKNNNEAFPVIEIFGKTEDGKSITVLCSRFYPYFVILNPLPEQLKRLKDDKEVVKTENVNLFYEDETHPAVKVYVRVPGTVPDYRERYNALAADITFKYRFLFDNNLGYCIEVKGIPYTQSKYKTDEIIHSKSIKHCDNINVPLSIMSFDIENLPSDEIICIGVIIEKKSVLRKIMLEGPEDKILKDFFNLIIDEDIDILSGFNVCNYDFPHIMKRSDILKIPYNVARNGRAILIRGGLGGNKSSGKKYTDKGTVTQIDIPGRLIIDTWYFARKEKRPKRETLGAMSEMILGEEKLDVDTSKMKEEWADNSDRVKEYCMQDTLLSHKILKRIRVIDKYDALSEVVGLPIYDTLQDRSSVLIDSLLIREADKHSVAVPNNRRGAVGDTIQGGYVHKPKPGLYDYVIVLDFASLYPSVIIDNNICPTTVSDKGSIITSAGVRFLDKKTKCGILPQIMEGLLKARKDSKQKMKSAKTDEERDYYNRLQLAQKILANAHYGVFASRFYRFTDTRIGNSITAIARDNITRIIHTLEEEKYNVIYSDTDSVFIVSPDKTLDGSIKFGEGFCKRFSKGALQLEFEKVINPFFLSDRKKRYFGRIVYPDNELIVRGFETRRGDSFPLQSETMDYLFNKILERDIDGGVTYVRGILKDLIAGKIGIEKLIISKTVSDESSYKVISKNETSSLFGKKTTTEVKVADRIASVQAKRKAEKFGTIISPGMKVSYVVTDASTTPQTVEPFIDGIPFQYLPDLCYYKGILLNSYLRILDVLGYTMEDLIEIPQLRLF